MITITREKLIYAMSASNPPVCRVPPKTDICFQTCDCFEDQIESKDTPFNGLDWNRINPATGPVYIEGAQPGDILKVTIKAITVTAKQAVMVTMPQLGVLGDELTQAEVKIVPLQDGFAHLPGGIQYPLKPMIGVIGVAPEEKPFPAVRRISTVAIWIAKLSVKEQLYGCRLMWKGIVGVRGFTCRYGGW
ncbi:Acetamidase/Formamidase family [Pragia fontium]|uniref:acetamidase/formamidase family protein n=1 Tax=Pragia fontium TaxID=82985 RepID=UPI000DFCB2DE|nr:acetamidase/formamidase family protein [Pragia fontium]SUC81359.1 Acetamidase/Formamidase family [Pragia fontium]